MKNKIKNITNMKNLTFIIIISILLIILHGCNLTNSRTGEPTKTEYHTGTKGLEIKLINNLPPDEIIEGESFTIGVELKNQGAYDISDGTLYLTNIPDQYIDIDQKSHSFSIEGKNIDFPDGGFGIINYNIKTKALPKDKEELNIPFRILADYDYKTKASAQVCVSSDIYGQTRKDEDVCSPDKVDFKSGQGAPITISEIEPTIKPYSQTDTEVKFKIQIRNSGSGEVIEKINVDEVSLGTNFLSCSPEELTLDNKEGTFFCSAIINKQRGEYVSPMLISLNYRYSETIDEEIKIIKVE